MSGILQVESTEFQSNVNRLFRTLDDVRDVLRIVMSTGDHEIVDWEMLRDRVDSKFNMIFDNLSLLEDDELDIIQGEEDMQIDTTLHPLDPENEDDEWFEGFDDA